MALSEWFSWLSPSTANDELPEIYPFPVLKRDFIETDIVTIYSKILTDVLERTDGLTEEQTALMWDNCVKSNSSDGLVTRLSKAMADRKDLFLVYEKAVKVIRPATNEEQTKIKADYEKTGESSVGIYISFKNFTRSDMIKLYIALDYCTVGSLYKSMNLSNSLQLKMSDMRASVSLSDAAIAKAQAQEIARGLIRGCAVLLDAKDMIETAKPDLTATQEAVTYTVKKLAFYLGLPDSYLIGEQTSGLGSSGENDMRAVERGLKAYYFSIIKPVLEAMFGGKYSYKSQDFRQITGAMEVLKTFALVDEELISVENKTMLINQLLGLPEDAEGDGPDPEPQVQLPAPGQVPPKAAEPKS